MIFFFRLMYLIFYNQEKKGKGKRMKIGSENKTCKCMVHGIWCMVRDFMTSRVTWFLKISHSHLTFCSVSDVIPLKKMKVVNIILAGSGSA